jgi:hypothetical protein
MRRKNHPFALAAAFATLATGTCVAAMFIHGGLKTVPGMPLAAVMLLALDVLLFARLGRWALGDRGRAVTALAAGGLSVPLVVAALHALDEPVAYVLGPPHDWMASALAGLVLAGVLSAARRRPLVRRRDAIAGGREGVLEESGMIRFDDGEPPVRAAPGQRLAAGPVVVLPGALAPGGVYRGDASRQGALVVCGTKDELLVATSEAMARLDALAFAACALSGAPLAAAAILGLVF